MRRFMMTMAAVMILQPHALSAQVLTEDQIALCRGFGRIAAQIMQERQDGASMSDLMEKARRVSGSDEFMQAAATAMIRDAFARERHTDPRLQELAIEEFRTYVEAPCFEDFVESN